MIYYAKITAANPKVSVIEKFYSLGADDNSIVLDSSNIQKQDDSIYQSVKKSLLDCQKGLVIDSISSLGKNGREIAKELQWFYDNNVHLSICDIPSTFEEAVPPIKVLCDWYSLAAAAEIKNVKEKQREGIKKSQEENITLGRKRIPYPSNWESAYSKWENKEISATEFMEMTGLKKGTLYNLIKQYKKQVAEQELREKREA